MTSLSRRDMRVLLAVLLLGVTSEACGSAEALYGPPRGSALVSTVVTARPFGLAVGRGVALVTQLDGPSITTLLTEGPPTISRTLIAGPVPTGIAATSDGTTALVASQGDTTIALYDMQRGIVTGRFAISGAPARTLLSANGARGYGLSVSGELVIVDMHAGTTVARIATGLVHTNGLALSPDGAVLYVTSTDGGIAIIDLRSNTPLRTLLISGRLQDVVVSPDGRRLYVADERGNVHAVDIERGGDVTVPIVGAFGLAMTGDGAQLWVTQPFASTVSVIDRASLTLLRTIPISGGGSPGRPRRIGFDRSAAVIADETGFVHVIR